MRILTLLLGLALAWAFAAPAHAQTLSEAEVAIVDAAARQAVHDGAPSVSVAIVRNGQIAFARAYGRRALAPDAPATVESRYLIGSVSKQFTATAILMLAADGRLSLDDRIGARVPGLTAGDRTTLRQVLSHTAGIASYFTSDTTPLEGRRPVQPRVVAARWGGTALDFEPGLRWSYSNTGFTVAGLIVETVSGLTLDRFLQARVFDPLHMDTAGDVDVSPLGPADATGYTRYALGPVRPARAVGAGWLFAAGGLAMSAPDLARWDIAMLDRALMPASAYDAQQTEVKLNDGSGSGYGLGLYVDGVRGHRRLRHDGSIDGFGAENRIYPGDRSAIVVLTNADFASPYRLADQIEAMLFSAPVEPSAAPPPAPASAPIAPSLSDPDVASERATAMSLYAEVRDGRLNRSRLGPDANDYFSPAVAADYAASLGPLGDPPQFIMRRRDLIGGLNASLYELVWPDRTLICILRLGPGGRVESFVVFPA